METTFSARLASSTVNTPMPGPISSTPRPGAAPQASAMRGQTVGFIRKLPHHLIEAFKSTLEEAKYADIIIHVVDVSNPRMDEQMYVVYDTLRQMGAEGKPVITLFNKQDRLEKEESHKDFQADYSIATSAKTGQGLDKLKAALLEIIRRDQIYVERLYPFADAGKIQMIRSKGQLLSEEYLPEGIQIKAYVPQDVYGKL